MFEKLKLFLALFRQGEEVSDPKVWKDRQNAANKIAALLGTLVLLAKAFGVEVPLSMDEIAGLALFVGGAGNWVFTTITSKKVGLPAQPSPPPVPEPTVGAVGPAVQPQGQAAIDEDLYRG